MTTLGGTWQQEGGHGAGTSAESLTNNQEGGREEGMKRGREGSKEVRREKTEREIGTACHGACNLKAHTHNDIPPNPSQVDLVLKIEHVNI